VEKEQPPVPDADAEALAEAQRRNRLLYDEIDRRASAFRRSSPIRQAIDEAVARARPPETVVQLPDDENKV